MDAYNLGREETYATVGYTVKTSAAAAVKSLLQRHGGKALKGTLLVGAAGVGGAGAYTAGKVVGDARAQMGDLPSQAYTDYPQYAVPYGHPYGYDQYYDDY